MMKKQHVALVVCSLLLGCSGENATVNEVSSQSMLGAVMHSDTDRVRRLAQRRINLEELDPTNNSTPMIFAAETDQWPAVEILIDNGADIWAHDRFGITAAQNAVTSRILRGSPEDAARLRVIEKMKAQGYPFPPPNSDEVLSLSKRGAWPPRGEAR
jgi:hypothetical protein